MDDRTGLLKDAKVKDNFSLDKEEALSPAVRGDPVSIPFADRIGLEKIEPPENVRVDGSKAEALPQTVTGAKDKSEPGKEKSQRKGGLQREKQMYKYSNPKKWKSCPPKHKILGNRLKAKRCGPCLVSDEPGAKWRAETQQYGFG